MTIEQDFVFLNRWLNERGGERAKDALSRIEAVFREELGEDRQLEQRIEELERDLDALKAALETIQQHAELMVLDETAYIANIARQALEASS